jgi:GGDEF domain-containing protein
MDERWVLIDPETGLHVGWYFWLRVLDEANRAARYGVPFGLFLLEAVPEHGRAISPRVRDEAAALVPAVIRSTDLGGRLGNGRVGIVLPHQDVAALEQAAARITSKLEEARFRGLRWHTRMLSHPRDAAEISSLLTNGWPDRRAASQRRRPSEQLV